MPARTKDKKEAPADLDLPNRGERPPKPAPAGPSPEFRAAVADMLKRVGIDPDRGARIVLEFLPRLNETAR